MDDVSEDRNAKVFDEKHEKSQYKSQGDHQNSSSVLTDSAKEYLSTDYELKVLKFEFAKFLGTHERLKKKAHQN